MTSRPLYFLTAAPILIHVPLRSPQTPLKSEIARVHVFPPREGEFGEFTFKNPEINALVEELGFSLYHHQVEALEKLYAGKNIVVTTPTASGKSEIFRLAIFDSYLSDPRKTYLLVYPTRALINNQLEKFQRANLTFYRITGKLVPAKILTGGTSLGKREEGSSARGRGLSSPPPRTCSTTTSYEDGESTSGS
ncbi:DEAD/DEAH box helicase [Thermococcus sp. JCM 11816]|uniref:DEAD/DEAH box helicase n=1 Tax=Thermococcus sp. (strain JCM 11816 / KS-1) TaxID=1295125 RepID=UPI000AA369B5